MNNVPVSCRGTPRLEGGVEVLGFDKVDLSSAMESQATVYPRINELVREEPKSAVGAPLCPAPVSV